VTGSASVQSRETGWPAAAILTVGHSTLSLQDFTALLDGYGVRRLVDVRTIPRSRHNPQFNADVLAQQLPAAGIDYRQMPALGGLRHSRKDSPNTGWRNQSFRGYADYMQTEQFQQALAELVEGSRAGRTAIMCAEALPWRCHRSLIADALYVRGIPAVEILSRTGWRVHELTAFARVDGIALTYPP
jgi:uncharacterized protein (DUF488 family)